MNSSTSSDQIFRRSSLEKNKALQLTLVNLLKLVTDKLTPGKSANRTSQVLELQMDDYRIYKDLRVVFLAKRIVAHGRSNCDEVGAGPLYGRLALNLRQKLD